MEGGLGLGRDDITQEDYVESTQEGEPRAKSFSSIGVTGHSPTQVIQELDEK